MAVPQRRSTLTPEGPSKKNRQEGNLLKIAEDRHLPNLTPESDTDVTNREGARTVVVNNG